jgi:hypothetical protein
MGGVEAFQLAEKARSETGISRGFPQGLKPRLILLPLWHD